MLLIIVDFLCITIAIAIALSQFFIPLFTRKPLFPLLRRTEEKSALAAKEQKLMSDNELADIRHRMTELENEVKSKL